MSRIFHQSERFDEELSLVLFDIDHFKLINDKHGHGAGDQVLRDIGIILQKSARKSDIPARLGGDEFGIILYRTGAKEAEGFVSKLVSKVREHEFSHDGVRLTVSLSLGIAQYSSTMGSPQALYYAADKALYWAKNNGRDQHNVYSAAFERLH
jgi:diguanylate cyclase (GGDEF)-like protein